MSDPFANLSRGHYATIAADPPWKFVTRSPKGEGRSASQYYGVMSVNDLVQLQVADLAASDAHLFMWTTGPHLPQAIGLIESWGFTYSAIAFTWLKVNGRSYQLFYDEPCFFTGLGYTTRKNSELCLLGRRGSPKRLRKDVRELIIAPRREHSRKPDEFFERVQAYAAGPYLELFSRETRPGWTCWGDQVGKFDEVAA